MSKFRRFALYGSMPHTQDSEHLDLDLYTHPTYRDEDSLKTDKKVEVSLYLPADNADFVYFIRQLASAKQMALPRLIEALQQRYEEETEQWEQ